MMETWSRLKLKASPTQAIRRKQIVNERERAGVFFSHLNTSRNRDGTAKTFLSKKNSFKLSYV